MSRGHLYWILSNPIYIGRLRHKGHIHDGLHKAIIDHETWDRVQVRLADQTQRRRAWHRDTQFFLSGKLYDDRGYRMGPSHAAKGARRWRYYVSQAILKGRSQDAPLATLGTPTPSAGRPPAKSPSIFCRALNARGPREPRRQLFFAPSKTHDQIF